MAFFIISFFVCLLLMRCLFNCLFISVFVHGVIYLLIFLLACLLRCLFICSFNCLFVYLFIYLFIAMFIYFFKFLCLFVALFICLFTYLFIVLSTRASAGNLRRNISVRKQFIQSRYIKSELTIVRIVGSFESAASQKLLRGFKIRLKTEIEKSRCLEGFPRPSLHPVLDSICGGKRRLAPSIGSNLPQRQIHQGFAVSRSRLRICNTYNTHLRICNTGNTYGT